MNTQFLWTIAHAEAGEDQAISAIHWRCERFDETGKSGEKTGVAQIEPSIPVSDFAEYGHEEQVGLIKNLVDTESVEDSFEAS